MKIKLTYKKHGWISVVGAILIVAAIFAFSWKVATGIWLIMMLAKGVFSVNVKKG